MAFPPRRRGRLCVRPTGRNIGFMTRSGAFALALVVVLTGCVTTTVQAPAAPPLPSYVAIDAGLMSAYTKNTHPPNPAQDAVENPAVGPGTSIAIDWGGFQSKYVAAGTLIGISRAVPSDGVALLLGGGTQFHIPIGPRFLLIPAIDLGYRITGGENGTPGGFGLATYASLAGAFRFDRNKLYAGLDAETPLFVQDPVNQKISFVPALEVKALFGFYY